MAQKCIALLNQDQHVVFDAIVHAIESRSGQSFFLHSAGGTGKTFVYNTLCYYLCGQGRIVICVASSGIASLLLIGGQTLHSILKIPIEIHETSMCNIRTNTALGDLICIADLIVWDEAPMQHCHIHKAVNRTFQDIHHSNALFGGLSVVFGGDFQQILLVIEKGSRPEVVGACLQRFHIWSSLQVLHLHQNMWLNTGVEWKRTFAQWQLEGTQMNLATFIFLPV